MSEVTGQSNNVKAFKTESFAPTPEVLAAWQAVYKDLRDEFGEAVYRSWLKPLTLQAYYHGTLEVSVPTRFMRDWIQTHYAKRILEMSSTRYDDIKRLEIVVVQNAQTGESMNAPVEDDKKSKGNDNKTVTMEDPFVHKGSRKALFGNNPTPQQVELLSLEKHVRSNSPPCFIVATMADKTVPVENSLKFYQSLRDAGVPAEMHIYAAGSHGDSRDPQYGPTAKWPERFEEWLRFNKWLTPEIHDFAKWEKEVAAMEAGDKTNPPPKNASLFIGSSTVRLWTSLAQDFPNAAVINRGFGGTEIVDSTHFAERLIFPHAPKQIFLRSAGNDLWAGKSPEQVFTEFKEFVARVHAKLPETEIIFISLCPSPSRWAQAGREKKLNDLIARFVKGKARLGYVETYDLTLGSEGKPRPELFVSDMLHLNADGYKLFAERVSPSVLNRRNP